MKLKTIISHFKIKNIQFETPFVALMMNIQYYALTIM